MSRLQRLSQTLEKAGLDALVLNPSPSLTYFTGLQFHLMERPIVAIFTAEGSAALILPKLEMPKIASRPEIEAFPYEDNPAEWSKAFRRAVEALRLGRALIGVEPTRLRFLELSYLQQAAPRARFISAADAIASLRAIKDEDEIAAMRTAVEIAQKALQAALSSFKVGMTEQEFAAEMVLQLLRHGSAPELPFQPIVAAGENAANPHATPTPRPIKQGDLLIVDWGANYKGYFSDLTRTFAIGTVAEELAHIAAVVQEANAAGRAVAAPNVPAGKVDAAAREVIAKAGYAAFFTHRTGHGLGLDVHEPPFIYGDNPLLLQPGMTFTVEPGIYLPGKGGVRVEDDVVITADAAESLSTLPRGLWRLE